MKKYYFLILFFGVQFSWAQEEHKALTIEDFASLKKVEVPNLAKDTYLKTEDGFILDRPEKPPYLFKFSDGLIRKIYLFQVFEAKELKQIARLAFYHRSDQEKAFAIPIPTTMSSAKVWGLYLDEIKKVDSLAFGLASGLAFVLSKEGNCTGEENASESESEEEYEFCFPASARVQLHDGSESRLDELSSQDLLWSANAEGQKNLDPIQSRLEIHSGHFSIWKVHLSPLESYFASQQSYSFPMKYLEATPNHPVWTQRGKVALENLQIGDQVQYFERASGVLKNYKVEHIEAEVRWVDRVYNLKINSATYLINGVLVFSK